MPVDDQHVCKENNSDYDIKYDEGNDEWDIIPQNELCNGPTIKYCPFCGKLL